MIPSPVVGADRQDEEARWRKPGLRKLGLLVLLTAATLSLHYMIFPFPHWIHMLHRRLCYVPILMGGLWFGLRGGLAVSLVISGAILPLAVGQGLPLWNNQDLIEILFYISLGVLTGVLVDRRDAERRHRENLQASMAENRRLAALGQMAAGIAHEIRTPLGSIQGATEIIERDLPPDHPRRRFWVILQQESSRLNAVVQDFLDLGRPLTVDPRLIDARAAIDESVRSLQGLAGQRCVTLEVDAPGTFKLLADPQRLYQALTNLLRNAIQVSPGGGTVRIMAASAGGGAGTIAVDDEGPGLPPGEEERVFEPFFSRRKDGTGLGLALVQQILHAHGGRVEGATRNGGGARFVLHFPGKAS